MSSLNFLVEVNRKQFSLFNQFIFEFLCQLMLIAWLNVPLSCCNDQDEKRASLISRCTDCFTKVDQNSKFMFLLNNVAILFPGWSGRVKRTIRNNEKASFLMIWSFMKHVLKMAKRPSKNYLSLPKNPYPYHGFPSAYLYKKTRCEIHEKITNLIVVRLKR